MKKLLFIFLLFLVGVGGKSQPCQAYFTFMPDTLFQVIFFEASTGNPTNWFWDFGDGDTSILQNPLPHIYDSAGIYTVCLSIYDSITACTDTFCQEVFAVSCVQCLAYYYYFPDTTPNTVKFNAIPINHPSYPFDLIWYFGDGDTSTAKSPYHTYATPGDYVVCLTTYDSAQMCICESYDTISISTPNNVAISICENGSWSDPDTWHNGSVPAPTDSVLIYHNIILDTDVTLTPPGLLYIDEPASLCGHYDFTGRIIIFGYLTADYVTINGPGDSYTDYIPVNSLYGMTINGSWGTQYLPSSNPFTCNTPNPCGTGIKQNEVNQTISIYPNPTTGKFRVENLEFGVEIIQIFDLFGRLLLRSNKEQIDMSSYPAGLYVWQVGTQRGKLVLE